VFAPSKQVVLSLVGYRVLVVHDNQINRLIAREMMTSCGAEVGEAECGAEALVAVHQACTSGRPFQIILLDMRMPGMDGLEVARRIRDDHLPIEPLILMLSSSRKLSGCANSHSTPTWLSRSRARKSSRPSTAF
jgi:CheY-like chemotaxis protein